MERRRFTAWLVALAVIVIAFTATVITLNQTLYSASGFASSYLSALARHDLSGAIGTPGVTLPAAGSHALLRADAMGGLTNVRLQSDSTADDGSHTITYSYSASGTPGSTTFSVERAGVNLGLFSAWRFATSPATVLSITPEHAATFTANGVDFSPPAGENQPTRYVVLTPAAFVLSHSSTYLTAPKKTVLVADAGSAASVGVDVQADKTFVAAVQKELTTYLTKCVTQHVLLPTGCPMGQQITDRVQDVPAWSLITTPKVTLLPGTAANSWVMPSTPGTAHLVVTVKSIFDGAVSSFNRDVAFTVSYVITIRADDTLLITAQN